MAPRTEDLSDDVYSYLLRETLREPELFRRLRDETAALPNARMQISPEQGQLMMMLVELIGARQALEIGTFTGYSALCVATALPHDGKLIACDVNEEWTAVGKRYWREAGVADRIDLRIAPAEKTLDGLLAEGRAGDFDYAFIDADKTSYDVYYERCLSLVRPGGLILIDNALRGGTVACADNHTPETVGVRELNRKIRADERVSAALVPISDGVWLVRKRSGEP